jgi:hypothetical protein
LFSCKFGCFFNHSWIKTLSFYFFRLYLLGFFRLFVGFCNLFTNFLDFRFFLNFNFLNFRFWFLNLFSFFGCHFSKTLIQFFLCLLILRLNFHNFLKVSCSFLKISFRLHSKSSPK